MLCYIPAASNITNFCRAHSTLLLPLVRNHAHRECYGLFSIFWHGWWRLDFDSLAVGGGILETSEVVDVYVPSHTLRPPVGACFGSAHPEQQGDQICRRTINTAGGSKDKRRTARGSKGKCLDTEEIRETWQENTRRLVDFEECLRVKRQEFIILAHGIRVA